jgi:hypothetical protein
VAVAAGYGPEPMDGGALNWTNWVAGVVAVYACLFGSGRIIFGDVARGGAAARPRTCGIRLDLTDAAPPDAAGRPPFRGP